MTALRRIAAYLIDYGVILVWLALLFLVAVSGLFVIDTPDVWTSSRRWISQGQAFLLLTLPVLLYFILFEAFGRKATLGKRMMGLQVIGSLRQIILRNVIKFLPWELAHMAIWHGMPVPAASEPTMAGLIGMVISLGLAGLYILTLFIRSGRTPYDRISGTQVIRKTVTAR